MHRLLGLTLAALLPLTAPAAPAAAAPVRILFVGNSYTFGRVDPVMSYNAAKVHDLSAGFWAANPGGTNAWEPHPWGGVPGLFKKMADEAGLNYDVSLSTRNAASLRSHFLNTANATWDLRGNVASQTWDKVVLQEQSDAALPAGKGRNANLAAFNAYADKFEHFIHDGAAQSYTETQLYGGLAACMTSGQSQASCNTVRHIPANSNASAATQVYLEQTWARPDMVEAHRITTPDRRSPDGSPIVDSGRAGGTATPYYASLAAMTADLHNAFHAKAAGNPGFAGVVPVGDAFQRAVDQGLAADRGFYGPAGTWIPPAAGLDLWWKDRLHASKYGSYLSALTLFGRITGRDPLSLGRAEQAAAELGISAEAALALQQVASQQLGFKTP